ncbi:MAG: hypothetical protein ACOY4R_27655 [Pseudomonadota bacterium]
MYQPFVARGIHSVSTGDVEDAKRELEASLIAWLAINLPVVRWRVAPEITVWLDFATNRTNVAIHARGFLDLVVPIDTAPLVVDLS